MCALSDALAGYPKWDALWGPRHSMHLQRLNEKLFLQYATVETSSNVTQFRTYLSDTKLAVRLTSTEGGH